MNMKIETCVSYPDDTLERFRPLGADVSWQMVASGYWSEGIHHSGYIAYYITPAEDGRLIMDGVDRDASATKEDMEEGRLNDDQVQAMWGMTLDDAQNQE